MPNPMTLTLSNFLRCLPHIRREGPPDSESRRSTVGFWGVLYSMLRFRVSKGQNRDALGTPLWKFLRSMAISTSHHDNFYVSPGYPIILGIVTAQFHPKS